MTAGHRLSFRYGTIDHDYGLKLAGTPATQDGPVWMVNLMKYREVAAYPGDAGPAISGQEADDRYAPVEILDDIGAEVAFFGPVTEQVLGASPTWDRIGVVRYPTRRSFVEMQDRPDFRERHQHKVASMEATIVLGTLPLESPVLPPDAPRWDQVEHPPLPDDGPVVVVQVLRFESDQRSQVDLADYERAAGAVAVRHGVRVGGWFAVEGTILGDGRTWDQVRFTTFPSMAAFDAVTNDPQRLVAQQHYRGVAIADGYTMVVRPQIDQIAAGAPG